MIGHTNVRVKPNKKRQYVDYLESSGTQYIDTGLPVAPNFYIDADIMITDTPDSVMCLMGTSTVTEAYRFWVCTFQIDTLYPNCALMNNSIATKGLSVNTKYNIYSKFFDGEQNLYINDELYCSATNTSTSDAQSKWLAQGSLYIGKAVQADLDYFYIGRIYGFKIYDKDNVLIRDFRPAKDEAGVYCLYDEVTKTYFYNQGTGEFLGGASI